MKIDLCFSGYLQNVNIEYVTNNNTGKKISVKRIKKENLLKGFDSGKYSLSLRDCLDNSAIEEISITDIEENLFNKEY